MSKKPKKQRRSTSAHGVVSVSRVRHAQKLIQKGDYEGARDSLYSIARRNPSDVAALALLSTVSAELEDARMLWYASTRLANLLPNDPIHWYHAAMACLTIHAPFSAAYYSQHFLEHWPDHEDAPTVRKYQKALADDCENIRESYGMAAERTTSDLMLFEEARMLTEMGDYKEGRRVAQLAAQRVPDAAPPLNNLSLSYMLEGDFEEALRISRQVLDRFPNNLHALANTTQFLVRLGHLEEARQTAERLCNLPFVEPDDWVKRSEALTYLGEDSGVIETYELVEKQKHPASPSTALGFHLAAVAYARQGDLKSAHQLWRKALKIEPDMAVARDNLEDLDRPVEGRTGAWPFAFNQWIPEQWVRDMLAGLTGRNPSSAAISRSLQRAIRDHPEMESTIPILFGRGDPVGCDFALRIAVTAKLSALRDFALGQHGTDQQRIEAGNAAVDMGLLPRGKPTKMFMRGEWADLMLMSYEIHERTQRSSLPRPAQKLMEMGYEAQLDGDHEEGLRLCEQALAIAPDHPSLLNHKAAALGMLGRIEESRATVRQMAELHPDYFFARCAMAELCARDGKLDEARQWLDPLLARPSLHVSEFAAMCKAHVELMLADGQIDGARTWLGFLKDINPDHPIVAYLEQRIRKSRRLF